MSSILKTRSATLGQTAKPRHQLITQTLREQIQSGIYKAGQTLPSYRDLMETYGVTVGTIRQAMLTLQNQQLIQSQPGVGCVVNDPSHAKLRCKVGLAIVGTSQMHWLFSQRNELQQQIDLLHIDLSLRFVESDSDEHLESLLEWSRRIDGVMLAGHVTLRIAKALAAEPVSVLQLGELIDGPCPSGISHVSVDASGLSALAVTHLVGLGHERIALSVHGAKTRYYQMICDGFEDTMAQYDKSDGASVLRSNVNDTNHVHDMITWLKSQPKQPTALIVEGGVRANLVINTLREIGMRVPQDISVLGIASTTPNPGEPSDLSGVATSGRTMVAKSMEALRAMHESRIAGGPVAVRMVTITPQYMPGKSAAAPPGQP